MSFNIDSAGLKATASKQVHTVFGIQSFLMDAFGDVPALYMEPQQLVQ